jgi:hypothetical protein
MIGCFWQSKIPEHGAIVNINLIHWPSKSDPLALA